MKLPPNFMVFDVESIGLHGEGFAVGFVVFDRAGYVRHEDRFVCPADLAAGAIDGRQWVAANVPQMTYTHDSLRSLRDAFWHAWQLWRSMDAVLVADVAWPVEARFLATCVEDDPATRAWLGPYPLHELTSIALALGADVEALWSERRPNELPAHDPLNDARHSARILAQLLKAAGARA
ncbi:hypothetical protein [Roseateles sp. P5_E7]